MVYMDNNAAIGVARNPEFYTRSKHIHIAFHFIRQRVDLKQIHIAYKKTKDMLADFLTKPLALATFAYCRDNSGLAEK